MSPRREPDAAPRPRPRRHPLRAGQRLPAEGRPARGPSTELTAGTPARRQAPGAARRHGQRQDLHHRLGARAGEPAGPGPRPQQDARRPALPGVQGLLPEQRGRVLRLLLRLLPARGLRPPVRHLHREGSDDQRRDRPHAAVARPAACSSGATSSSWPRSRASTAWARPRPTTACCSSCARATPSTGATSSPSWSRRATTATTSTSSAAPSACAGDVIEIVPAYEETGIRIELFGDEVESITVVRSADRQDARPARPGRDLPLEPLRHPAAAARTTPSRRIEAELLEREGRGSSAQGKLLEAQRLYQRTMFDLEMLREIGHCHGIENYSRHLSGRAAGRAAARPCSTTCPRTRSWSSTSSHQIDPPGARRCTTATGSARRRSSSTASACPPRSTTGR